jgi:ubiquinone/menaquinone biosynthesis C-methylase UbiE
VDRINEYYSKRAQEYEQIYQRNDPIRQSEQNKIAEEIKKVFHNKRVLEIACGTGFWTAFLSEVAKEIVAIDNSDEVLEIAQHKKYRCPADFQKCDAYNLPFPARSFDGGLASFWFSHIPKEKIKLFLDGFHRVLLDKAIVFMADNVFNEGIGGKLVRVKGENNTYKIRILRSGEKYRVLKNYYSRKEIVNIFSKSVNLLDIYFGNCFWYVCYEVKK